MGYLMNNDGTNIVEELNDYSDKSFINMEDSILIKLASLQEIVIANFSRVRGSLIYNIVNSINPLVYNKSTNKGSSQNESSIIVQYQTYYFTHRKYTSGMKSSCSVTFESISDSGAISSRSDIAYGVHKVVIFSTVWITMNSKALSLVTVPADIRERYASLFNVKASIPRYLVFDIPVVSSSNMFTRILQFTSEYTDYNNHINNKIYTKMCYDFAIQSFGKFTILECGIYFQRECKEGDVIHCTIWKADPLSPIRCVLTNNYVNVFHCYFLEKRYVPHPRL